MASEKFANRPAAQVAATYTASDTTLEVDDASDFPAEGVFRVLLGNTEGTIFRVDSVAGDVFTGAAEAFDGNAAIGVSVRIVASQEVAERFLQEPTLAEIAAYGGPIGVRRWGPLWPLTPLDQSAWAWVNQGTASVVQASGIVYLLTPGAGGTNVRGRFVTAPAMPYTITVAMIPGLPSVTHAFCGLCLREASTGKLYDIHVYNQGALHFEQIRMVKWTNPTTVSGVVTAATRTVVAGRGLYFLRVTDNGTNLIFSYSPDGVNWMALNTEARGTFMAAGSGPTEVGIDISNEDTTTLGGASCSFLSWIQT